MPITNNNLAVIDLPTWEVLQPLQAASSAGVCCANDKRGTDRYVYWLFSATSFWRYCVYSNSWQQLASPPAGVVGAGTSMVYDPSRGTAGYVWAYISNGTTVGFGYFDIAANAWTARTSPGVLGTDTAMAHTCTTYNVGGNDDFIYLIGNNATALQRFSIVGNTWASLTVAGSASGAGCHLAWMPSVSTDRLYRLRGGATAVVDYYGITATTWTTITPVPATETYTTGTNAVQRGIASPRLYVQKDATGRVHEVDVTNSTIKPQATQYLIAQGAAVIGERTAYVKDANGIEFYYTGVNTSAAMLRTPIYF